MFLLKKSIEEMIQFKEKQIHFLIYLKFYKKLIICLMKNKNVQICSKQTL
jgi:hypothetical protein